MLNFKRLCVISLVFCLLMTPLTIAAKESNTTKKDEPKLSTMEKTKNPAVFYDPQTDQYYDIRSKGYIGEVYEVKGGEIVKQVDIKEYIESEVQEVDSNETISKTTDLKYNTTSLDESIIQPNGPSVYSRYTETYNEEQRVYGSRASLIQENPGPLADTYSLAFSSTKSHQFNINLSYEKISALKFGVSYTYTSTASISSTHTMTIPAGYSGYWRFDPKTRYTMGTMQNYVDGVLLSTESTKGRYPVKFDGDLDGWLVAVKTPL